MAAPLSTDLRRKVLIASERGHATATIASLFSVSRSWVRRVKQRFRENGEIEARPMGGAHRVKIDRDRLNELVREQPDATLSELCDRIDVECSISGVDKALKSLDLTFKKRRSTPRNRTGPTSWSDAASGSSGRSALIPEG